MDDNSHNWGITQLYTVLSVESITDDHPAKEYFTDRFRGLRGLVVEALTTRATQLRDGRPPDPELTKQAAAAIIATMDGIQVQWLLDPTQVDMPETTSLVIDSLLDKLVAS